jgi:hypothetical protein
LEDLASLAVRNEVGYVDRLVHAFEVAVRLVDMEMESLAEHLGSALGFGLA